MLSRIEQLKLHLKNCQDVIDGSPEDVRHAVINTLSYQMELFLKELDELEFQERMMICLSRA